MHVCVEGAWAFGESIWRVQSVQSKMVPKWPAKYSPLSNLSFHCGVSQWRWSFLMSSSAAYFAVPLSTRQSRVSCPWPCAHRYCFKLLSISDLLRLKPLVMVALLPVRLLSFFLDSIVSVVTHRSFWKWMPDIVTGSAGFLSPPPFIFIFSKLTFYIYFWMNCLMWSWWLTKHEQSVSESACVVWFSLLSVQRKAFRVLEIGLKKFLILIL